MMAPRLIHRPGKLAGVCNRNLRASRAPLAQGLMEYRSSPTPLAHGLMEYSSSQAPLAGLLRPAFVPGVPGSPRCRPPSPAAGDWDERYSSSPKTPKPRLLKIQILNSIILFFSIEVDAQVRLNSRFHSCQRQILQGIVYHGRSIENQILLSPTIEGKEHNLHLLSLSFLYQQSDEKYDQTS